MSTWVSRCCFFSLACTRCTARIIQPELRCPSGYHTVCNIQQQPAEATTHGAESAQCWVAVLVDGVMGRFYPETTLRHVVAPSAQAGCVVDYYVMLSGSLHEGAFSAYWYRPVTNPRFDNMSWHAFEEYVLWKASRAGARRAALYLHSDVALDSFPDDPTWRSGFRNGARKSTTFIRNVLYLQALELLWNWTKSFQEHHLYSHIALVRGDIYWLQDLRLDVLDVGHTVLSRPFGHLCTGGFDEIWPDDRVFVMGSDVADHVLTAYSAFLYEQNPEFDNASCNEEFFMLLAEHRGVRWKFLPRDLMAYFGALHMKLPDQDPFLCLRGITRKVLSEPTGRCVHPSRVPLPFCEDFELV